MKKKNNLNKYIETKCKKNNEENIQPATISFLVTNRCNLKCKHCFYHETLDNKQILSELSLEEYQKLSKSMGNFLTGIFCGGEPFIRNDFYKIVNTFRKNNNMISADSASNGQLTNSIITQVKKILEFSPHTTYSLGISLDGIREIHNSIRGEGTFEKAIKTWLELKKLKKVYKNFELYICTTINTINENTMEKFLIYAYDELKPDKISLIKTRESPRAGEELKKIDIKNYLKCIKIIEERSRNKDKSQILSTVNNYIYDGCIEGKKIFNCYAGLHSCFIDFNGNTSVCEIMDNIGNLREYNMDFNMLWSSSSAYKIKKCVNKHKSCMLCTHESEGIIPSLYFEPNQLNYKRKY